MPEPHIIRRHKLADAYLRESTQNCPLAEPYFQQATVSVAYAEAAQEGLVECRRAALESPP